MATILLSSLVLAQPGTPRPCLFPSQFTTMVSETLFRPTLPEGMGKGLGGGLPPWIRPLNSPIPFGLGRRLRALQTETTNFGRNTVQRGLFVYDGLGRRTYEQASRPRHRSLPE